MSETPISPAPSPFYRAPPPRKRPAWRTWMWIGVAVLVAIVAAVLLTPHPDQHARGRGGGGGGAGGRGGIPTVVGVVTAVKGDIPINLGALGTVTPEATVTVQSQIAGTLETVNFKEGQLVKKGQLLAEVDTRPYVVALAQANGALARDQATLANAELDLKRYQTLAKQDSVSGQQVDTQAALVRQDEGTVKTDEANVASAKLNLVYCHIIAPVSGRVGLRQVDPGNYITAGLATGVVVIAEIDPIDIVFTLPEDDVPLVQARVAQGATLSVTALDRTGATTLAQGALLTLDNQIDTSTGTVKAKARFANPNGMLFPNQFVNVQLLVNTLKDAVIVPTQAVRHGSNGDYVFIVDQDPIMGGNIAKKVAVKSGPADGDRTSIASGVAVGDQVITDGGDRLTDGATILLPGHIPSMPHAKKPVGFFDWIAGLFGHKPDQTASAGGSTGGGASAGGGSSDASGSAAGGSGGGGGGGGGGGHGGGRMQAMFAQLNLTPDQQAKMKAIREAAQASGDFSGMREQIAAVLTPAQKAKLAQLRAAASSDSGSPPASSSSAASIAGPPSPVAPAPSAPDSSNAPAPQAPAGGGQGGHGGGGGGAGGRMGALNAILTDDQKAKVKAIIDEAKASGDFSGVREKIGAILTPDQKAKLAAMRAAHAGGGGGDQ
jgi:membrane fusion protein, multidrug efflux system